MIRETMLEIEQRLVMGFLLFAGIAALVIFMLALAFPDIQQNDPCNKNSLDMRTCLQTEIPRWISQGE